MTQPESFDPSQVRVGDRERTDALDKLGEHFASGYLTPAEFEERTGVAAKARTRGELSTLFADLPDGAGEQGTQSVPAVVGHEASLSGLSSSELDQMLSKKDKMDALDIAIVVAMFVAFGVGTFGFGWSFSWIAFPIGGLLLALTHLFFGISEEEDEVLEEIQGQANRDRAERLRIAHERRRELGK